MSDNTNLILRYNQTGLILLKHFLLEGTSHCFWEVGNEAICTYFPSDDGIACTLTEGTGDQQGNILLPGSYIDLQYQLMSSQYNAKRNCEVIKSGYTVCLLSTLKCRIVTKIVEGNFRLPPSTKAIVLHSSYFFTENGVAKTANQYNMIMDRPYELDLTGHGKLMVINIQV